MAKKDLSKLSVEELVKRNNELTEKRATAVAEIKSEQEEINLEISRRNLQQRARQFTDDEIAEIAAMRHENPQAEVEPEVDQNNG